MEILLTNQIFWNYDSVHSLKWWILDLEIPNWGFSFLGVPKGPWRIATSRHARPPNRHPNAMLPVSRKERLRQRRNRARPSQAICWAFKHVNSAEKYGTLTLWHMTWHCIYIYIFGCQRFPGVFFLCFLWGSCRRRLPHSSVPSWKQRPMGAGGWMLTVDISSSRWIFRKAWSSDPDWYSNPPKLIFCDQSQIRESLRTRTEHWNQKPEVNISIKATQT